jgi:hypothetical protein
MNETANAPNGLQIASPSYRLAVQDQDFLRSREMRGARFLLEYEKADRLLQAHNIRSTIVLWGSARVTEDGPGAQARWYGQAREFGRIASQRGGAVAPEGQPRYNVIVTGGGPGLMEAANRGAREAGAPSIGFNIWLPHEQGPNEFTTPALTLQFHYFAIRKMHFAMRANALVVFPGGFGTLDELFEILTLCQTGKARHIPIVLFDEAYWRSIVNFEALAEHGMIDRADLDLFRFAESAEDVWSALMVQGIGVQALEDEDLARDM